MNPDLAGKDDRELVKETLAGSQAAFAVLIEMHQDKIFRLLHRFTKNPSETEDLAQDVFLKVYRRLHTFHFESAFYTWVYRIAVNTASDYLERKKRNPVQNFEDPGVFEKGEDREGALAPDRRMLDTELGKVTKAVLAEMSEKYRSILVLREFEELAYDEIAKILGCAMGTVESRLFRAREQFKEILEKRFPEYAPRTDSSRAPGGKE